MASPPRNDAWTPYGDVRFVLVQREGRTLKPFRGLVLDEKVIDNRSHVLVHYWVHDGYPYPHSRLDWVLRRRCWPIHVDPNELHDRSSSQRGY